MARESLRLDHLAIPCFDAAATHRFDAETLGLPLVDAFSGDDWGGKAWLMMIYGLGDRRQLAFCAFRGAKKTSGSDVPADACHYAFSVASLAELRRWKKKRSAAGLEVAAEDHGGQQSIYFTDPNGVVLEITAPASDSAMKADPAAAEIVRKWIDQSL